MRVALVGAGLLPIPPPAYGAVEKHIACLGRALGTLGHEVTIINDVESKGSLAEYRFARRVHERVRDLGADVVHVHTPGVASVFRTWGPNRFVYTTHSRHWTTRQGLRQRVGFALEKRACRHALATIAVTPRILPQLRQVGARATVIPNGVDTDLFRPHAGSRDGQGVIGLGAVVPHKRWHLAARALRDLPFRLEIIGPQPDPDYAQVVLDALPGRVELVGEVPEVEVVRRLAAADVMIHPSVSEASPMAVLEGMASGLPIVASDLVSDSVTHQAEGLLVPTTGTDDERVRHLHDALDSLARDPTLRRRLGSQARARAEAIHAWPRIAERVAAVYHAAQTGAAP